jgi:chromosome segregation ATPase
LSYPINRVLELEKEKAIMTEELSDATAKLTALQETLTELQANHKEAVAELNTVKEAHAQLSASSSALRAAEDGSVAKIEEITRGFKEEQKARKQVESELEAAHEELAEVQEKHAGLNKKMAQLKKKAATDKTRLEDEMEDLRSTHDGALDTLKRQVGNPRNNRCVVGEDWARCLWCLSVSVFGVCLEVFRSQLMTYPAVAQGQTSVRQPGL